MTTEPTVPFTDLGVPRGLCDELDKMGYTRAFPVQAATIPDALAGLDVCGQARTGSGKTLAFGLPLLARLEKAQVKAPTALVLVPTRELALQVTAVLQPLGDTQGARTLAIYGGAPIEPQIEALAKGVDVVVATPGRLIDICDREAMVLSSVSICVLDEADRMADLGFIPQVDWILRRLPVERQTMLFSATLEGAAAAIIRDWMREPKQHVLTPSTPTVTTMKHHFFKVHGRDKPRVVAAIANGANRIIVFCGTKRAVDQLTDDLRDLDVKASAMHGDRRQSDREKTLDKFSKGNLHVLVATDVAARGLHIDAVDVVVHYEPAPEVRTYLHRSGRTARAGANGVAVTLFEWNQELAVRDIIRRLNLDAEITEVFSNDPRLKNLT